jgi:hypothetical protein
VSNTCCSIILRYLARKEAAQLRLAILHRRQTEAAIVIQKFWRRRQAIAFRRKKLASIIFIQSVIRMKLARRLFSKMLRRTKVLAAAIVLQKYWRARLAKKLVRFVSLSAVEF